eukprot:CAMPEP_0172685574 /NCGR_PEP_ID=MMETSP1074-20121228/20348_1 /TAXON_ID=2916 /ORGANISM="Ceratium fusus, Strain PA161109" /LENGTH=120 /DNA_ID=CAMNT_0013504747 /DNA_START=289 /DNA_END=651 /DNA_ORIENTATION=-
MEEEGTGLLGITGFGQSIVGSVTACKLPDKGASFSTGDKIAVLDVMALIPKSTSARKYELIAPVDCEITAVNEALLDEPGLVNDDAEGEGWLVQISMKSDHSQLMDVEAYGKYVDTLEEV